jgi:hypothetical protein
MNVEKSVLVEYSHPERSGIVQSVGWLRDGSRHILLIYEMMERAELCSYMIIPKGLIKRITNLGFEKNDGSTWLIRHSFAVIGVPVSSQSSKESRRRYQQLVAQEAAKSPVSTIESEEKVKIEIDWFSEGFNNKPDADNIAKSIIDALKGIVFTDDKQVESHTVRKHDTLGVTSFWREPLSIAEPLLDGNGDYVFVRIY